MASMPSEPFILTPMDNIVPRVPVVKLLFFPSIPSISAADAIAALRDGLGKTIRALPLLAGTTQVIPTTSVDEQQGRLSIYAPWRTLSEIFQVRDLSQDSNFDYASLRAENFPVAKLPAATLGPAPIMADPSKKPVFFIQANIINGGIIMAMGTNHNFTDGNGTATVAKIWAAYCKGEEGSRYLTREVMDRGCLMPSGHHVGISAVEDYSGIIVGENTNPTTAAASDPKRNNLPNVYSKQGATMPNNEAVDNGTFFFPKTKLAELKSKASSMNSARDLETSSWISTNDALCSLLALCIHSTATAMGQDSKNPGPITMGLAINFRGLYDPPMSPDYIGNAVHAVRVTLASPFESSDTLGPTSAVWAVLAASAQALRRCINNFDVSRIKGLTTLLDDVKVVPDISKVGHVMQASDGDFLAVTSWAKQAFYECDFGESIGRPERVRMCRFAIPGLVVVAPERKGPTFEGKEEEGLEVMVGMERERFEKLKNCPLFRHFATWIGKRCEHQEGGDQEQTH